jgi:hypothetical protein
MNQTKQRKWIHISLGLVPVIGGLILFFNRGGEESTARSSPGSDSAGGVMDRGSRPDDNGRRLVSSRASEAAGDQQRDFGFMARVLPKAPQEPEAIENPKFSSGGSGTQGSIRDQAGKTIWRATEELPVYSISTSPDDRKIVVGAGDGKAYIISNEGEKIADLPQFPRGRKMLGLGNWVWLGNDRLLGESGVQELDANGKPIACCGGHNVSESRFFVYDLQTSKLEEIQLPEKLRGKVVSMGKVLKTGELQFGHAGDEPAWYQVTSLDEDE